MCVVCSVPEDLFGVNSLKPVKYIIALNQNKSRRFSLCRPVTLLMSGFSSPVNQILQKTRICERNILNKIMRNKVTILRSFFLYHSHSSLYHSKYSNHWANFLDSSVFSFLKQLNLKIYGFAFYRGIYFCCWWLMN